MPPIKPLTRHLVRVFATPDLEGTTAVVYRLDESLSSSDMQAIASNDKAPATCFIHQVSAQECNVRFFNATHEIQLCGHGLLACAKVLAEYDNALSFRLDTPQTVVEAHVSQEDTRVEIQLDALPSYAVDIPLWAKDCFNIPPEAASLAGPDSGYWVMRWPQSTALDQLNVNSRVLVENTQRALIVTQKSQVEGYDYGFRYFAPQHGVIEDKATGSAHRVLLSYWHQQLNQCNFKARQYSKEGAELVGRVVNGDVWISGNVDIQR
ncbi:PhzF family phenazine biosynthesis protein [Kangiella marina]|uniref:PhzF family phenazine biosynthesis protein n=1 Tax=Kangiella marina TaxID=1079178 RepID=A0ABP8IQ19_9GAMM